MERWIVSRLGGNPVRALELDLEREEDLGRWLVAAILLAGATDDAAAERAFRALASAGLDAPADVARATPERIARILAQADYARPERTALTLARASRTLAQRHGGSLSELAAGAEGLEELGARLAGLGRGVGAATVACLLRPLRSRWSAASDLPLSPAAAAAAAHLGLAWDGDADVEAALERLGRRACLRERPERCPLRDECPRQRTGA